ncbi:hypothetical protein AVEN_148240-1 [Araneus ventricosus]|uniref:Uncharacterized protein n=1 Tax=Araneus ventricosus TaxID=182803 RepID=A0A4Y2IEN1_ARAVE|nr:hypothetical protein AVEN_148240-1 [Araneus ventricosus]
MRKSPSPRKPFDGLLQSIRIFKYFVIETCYRNTGAAYIDQCPANRFLPWLVVLMGAETATVLIYLWVKMIWENYQTSQNIWVYHYWILEILLIIGTCGETNLGHCCSGESTKENRQSSTE